MCSWRVFDISCKCSLYDKLFVFLRWPRIGIFVIWTVQSDSPMHNLVLCSILEWNKTFCYKKREKEKQFNWISCSIIVLWFTLVLLLFAPLVGLPTLCSCCTNWMLLNAECSYNKMHLSPSNLPCTCFWSRVKWNHESVNMCFMLCLLFTGHQKTSCML